MTAVFTSSCPGCHGGLRGSALRQPRRTWPRGGQPTCRPRPVPVRAHRPACCHLAQCGYLALAGGWRVGGRLDQPDHRGAPHGGVCEFLAAKPPGPFVVGDQGAWGYATGDYVTGRALGFCQRSGQHCTLYAVDDDVVWPGKGRSPPRE